MDISIGMWRLHQELPRNEKFQQLCHRKTTRNVIDSFNLQGVP
jgi:hypothetical protein